MTPSIGPVVLALAILHPSGLAAQPVPRDGDYLWYARTFADTLIARGTDRYGSKSLPMWAALIDTRDYSVPQGTALEAERTKAGNRYFDVFDRRAVGGANIAQDFETLHAFDVLSALTSDPRYAKAAQDYIEAFLTVTQNEHTGLLGWGEHMYYDFYKDEVTVGGNVEGSDWTHEFLAKKPIWAELWRVSPERVGRAIQGLRYHFNSPYTHTFLFNRHASWQKVTSPPPPELKGTGIEQYQQHRAAFAAHAGLFAYSFMFLYDKTQDPEWLKWSRGVGRLHWLFRDAETSLVPWNIDARLPLGPQFGQTSQLAYRLYQTFEINSAETQMREHALELFNAAESYAWREKGQLYVDDLNMDGTPVMADDPRFNRVPSAPGDRARTLQLTPQFRAPTGRIAAYLYKHENNPHHLVVARRMIDIMHRDTMPQAFFAGDVADRIHLLMDVYDLTNEPQLLTEAVYYADRGIAGLWRGGLFARRVGDPFYESNDKIGSFVGALLRVHIARNVGVVNDAAIDWSY